MTILAVHNGPTTGGGFALTPRADPADGLLDVTLVPDVWLGGRVRRLVAALRGTLTAAPGTVELQAPWVELEHDVPLPVHLDGNAVVMEPPATRFEVVPAALGVAVPEG
jgi:diacylglycerol kinase family enzyme